MRQIQTSFGYLLKADDDREYQSLAFILEDEDGIPPATPAQCSGLFIPPQPRKRIFIPAPYGDL